jgi:hypothetical protein
VDIALPVLTQVVTCCQPESLHHDDEILMDSCWALSRILRGIHEGIEKVIVSPNLCAQFGALITYVQFPSIFAIYLND